MDNSHEKIQRILMANKAMHDQSLFSFEFLLCINLWSK